MLSVSRHLELVLSSRDRDPPSREAERRASLAFGQIRNFRLAFGMEDLSGFLNGRSQGVHDLTKGTKNTLAIVTYIIHTPGRGSLDDGDLMAITENPTLNFNLEAVKVQRE